VFRETLEKRDAILRFEINREAFFVPVDTEKIGTLAAGKWRTPTASVIADTGLFDLDDLGAQVAEKHAAIGTGQDTGEIENSDAIEGAWMTIAHWSGSWFKSFNRFALFKPFKLQ
jgi:hypothetical protein